MLLLTARAARGPDAPEFFCNFEPAFDRRERFRCDDTEVRSINCHPFRLRPRPEDSLASSGGEARAIKGLERDGPVEVPRGSSSRWVVEKDPCPSCEQRLVEYARKRGISDIEIHVPERASMTNPTRVMVTAKQAARTSFQAERPVLSGHVRLCLGLTEPEGGSDVATCKTRAVRDVPWILNGSKMFTSNAHNSQYVFLLTNTDPDAPKHKNLTMFLVPLDTPGIEIQGIRTVDGDRNQHHLLQRCARRRQVSVGRGERGLDGLQGGRPQRRRIVVVDGHGHVRDVRRLVGALHARGRPWRRIRCRAGLRRASCAARRVRGPAADGPVFSCRHSLEHAGSSVAARAQRGRIVGQEEMQDEG